MIERSNAYASSSKCSPSSLRRRSDSASKSANICSGEIFACFKDVTVGSKLWFETDDNGKNIKEALPSTPVEVLGFDSNPLAGDDFIVVESEAIARKIAEYRFNKTQIKKNKVVKSNVEEMFEQINQGKASSLPIIIKADVQGSAEALQSSLEQLGDERISVSIIHTGVGNITTTDITLASASDAIVIAFNVQVDSKAKQLRSQEGVDVRTYDIIYNALDDVKAAMEGLLEPIIHEEIVGRLEVRQVFNSAKNGMVFGGLVTEGRLLRNDLARVLRNGDHVYEGNIISLKRFKDDVREVSNNHECGLVMDFPEVQEGDVIVAYQQIEEKATL